MHDEVIKWKHFPLYWPIVRGIHRSPVNSPHKVQWRGALMFSLVCAWTNGFVSNRDAGDLRRHRAHYDVTVMDLGYRSSTETTIEVNKSDIRVQVIHWGHDNLANIFQTEFFNVLSVLMQNIWISIQISLKLSSTGPMTISQNCLRWWLDAEQTASHGPLARYVKLPVAHASGMPGSFSPPPTSKKTRTTKELNLLSV